MYNRCIIGYRYARGALFAYCSEVEVWDEVDIVCECKLTSYEYISILTRIVRLHLNILVSYVKL